MNSSDAIGRRRAIASLEDCLKGAAMIYEELKEDPNFTGYVKVQYGTTFVTFSDGSEEKKLKRKRG